MGVLSSLLSKAPGPAVTDSMEETSVNRLAELLSLSTHFSTDIALRGSSVPHWHSPSSATASADDIREKEVMEAPMAHILAGFDSGRGSDSDMNNSAYTCSSHPVPAPIGPSKSPVPTTLDAVSNGLTNSTDRDTVDQKQQPPQHATNGLGPTGIMQSVPSPSIPPGLMAFPHLEGRPPQVLPKHPPYNPSGIFPPVVLGAYIYYCRQCSGQCCEVLT